MESLEAHSKKLSDNPDGKDKAKDPEKEFDILLFLWAVENALMNKVSLYEAPDNEIFDSLAQRVWEKLDKKQEAPSLKSPILSPSENQSASQSSQDLAPKFHDMNKSKSPHDSTDGSSIAKFDNEGGVRGRKRNEEKRRGSPSPSPSSSDSGASSSSDQETKSSRANKSRERSSKSKSKGKPSARSKSKSSKTKSINSEDSDSPARKSVRTRESPPDSSPGSSSSSSSDSRPDSPSSPDHSRRRSGGKSRKGKRKKRRENQKKRGRNRRRRGRSPSSSGDNRDLNRTMTRSLQAMTESQLKRDKRADKNKLMLSRLAPEAGNLFTLLSAEDWNDSNPRLPSLTKKILEDRDSNRALGEVKSLSKRWTGRISEKGFLLFLANGYQADDITEAPGGFSVFSFSPLDHVKSSDPKTNIHLVRSMFGSTELDEESIKYFAKKDFYLADSLAGLEEQIYTCIKCLEMLTRRDGIASEGYVYGFQMLSKHKRHW